MRRRSKTKQKKFLTKAQAVASVTTGITVVTYVVSSESKIEITDPANFHGPVAAERADGNSAVRLTQVRVRSIPINPSVCASVCCLSVREHVSGTAGPIGTKLCARIPGGRGSVLVRQRCATLCISGFMDDVTFSRNGPYGVAWPA